jgi:PAS domain S-box-containing protein
MKDYPSNGSRLTELVGTINLHEHLCLIYERPQEQFSAILPFMKIGLERGEKCLYIGDTNTIATVGNAMRTQGIDVDAAIRQGRLTITKNDEIYPLRGDFDADRMIGKMTEAAKAARTAGLSALRWVGEMTWVAGIDPRPERLIEYEAKLNDFLRDNDALAICQYNRKLFPPEVILDVLRTHPTVVYGDLISNNPYYVPPHDFLQPHQAEREVQRLLNNIQTYAAAEQVLKASEQQSRALIDAIPQQIWTGPPDGTIDFCNAPWRSYTGLSLDELQGDVWQRMLHPDDRERVIKTWQESVRNGTPYESEERHRGADGNYRWFLSRAVPMRDAKGRILRWYGTNTDIEDRKRAEEELRRLSGRLLQLQDAERRKIARDLHDSTGQNLVALATMLSQLRKSFPSEKRKLRKLLSECKALADQCIREVRTLSYLLHPPVLDQSGLTDAIRDYVEGFTKRSGIHVRLELSPRVGRMPRDVELALFRVVQESLTNIQRHSGSHRAKIRIECNSDVNLEISDMGRGPAASVPSRTAEPEFKFGVGIPSMEERVKLVGGRLEIDSSNHRTTIRVTIPLEEAREKAAHSIG